MIVGHAHLWETYVAELALDKKPLLAQRREMGATRNEAHIASPLGESCAEITTNTARSHDGYFHRFIFFIKETMKRDRSNKGVLTGAI
jgi:hypothetical protein